MILSVQHPLWKTANILLLVRPDYTIFDEMRNTDDFRLFSDLRLSGVGMVGVLHATNTIDAIQRFIGRIELGVIPHVIDTVIFIKNGGIGQVFNVSMEVKVPSGMTEADLARPVVVVHDFETGRLEFEIYSYGEETIVIPIKKQGSRPTDELAAQQIQREFQRFTNKVRVDVITGNKAVVYVPEALKPAIIGRGGSTIEGIERKLGISIDVRDIDESQDEEDAEAGERQNVPYEVSINKKNINFSLNEKYANKDVLIYVDSDYLLTVRVSKKGVIKLTKKNKLGRIVMDAVNNEGKVELRA